MTEDERVLLQMASDGILRIDPDGLIWRLQKKHKEWGGYRDCTPRLLGQENHGYIRICIRDPKGVTRKAQAHRLVFMWHYGDIPEGVQVNHKDGVKHNNRVENLELMTPSQQMIHAIEVLGFRTPFQRNPGQYWKKRKDLKLTEEDYVDIRESDEPVKVLADRYGVTTARIYQVKNFVGGK